VVKLLVPMMMRLVAHDVAGIWGRALPPLKADWAGKAAVV
jgi:hypothetical protein